MSLSPAQKRAGRAFRDARQAVLDALNCCVPADGNASPLWKVVRHPCPERGGASVGIALREYYEASGEYREAGEVVAAAGLLAFIWKEGRCAYCGLVLRSQAGRVVLAASRPPEREYRVA